MNHSDTNKNTTKERKIYVDVLRVISMFAIICLHSSSPVLYAYKKLSILDWSIANIFNSACRWGTLVFLMLSGLLLLPSKPNYSIGKFLKRRLYRIGLPFLGWSVIYSLLVFNKQLTAGEFPWQKMLHLFLTGESYTHLWFVYMIMALYFITPILRIFITHANPKEVWYYFYLWFAVRCLFFVAELILQMPLTIAKYVDLMDYAGIYIAGYYLDQIDFKKQQRQRIYILALVGFVITVLGPYIEIFLYQEFNGFFYNRLHPHVMFMALGVFVWFKNKPWVNIKYSDRWKGWLKNLQLFSVCSYGIYLAHQLVLVIIRQGKIGVVIKHDFLIFTEVSPLLGIPVTALCALLLSFLLTYLLRKIPIIKHLST